MGYFVKRLCSKVAKEYRNLCHFLREVSAPDNIADAHFLRALISSVWLDS